MVEGKVVKKLKGELTSQIISQDLKISQKMEKGMTQESS